VESDDNEDQCEWKLIDDDENVPSPISPNIQHSDVFGTQNSTTTKVFKKKKKT
jgi:hypothetical protein